MLSRLHENTVNAPKLSIPLRKRICTGCTKGKMTQKPFRSNPTRATRILELVHSDLFELPILSYHKFKWVMTLFDDFSSHAHIVMLRKKSEAAPKMVELLTLLMNQSGHKVKGLQTDRGGEFMSQGLQGFLRTNGIQHISSAPNIHQQNGRAERLNRTLHEKAQSMRLLACLPDSWWEFAMSTATHVYNCTPMK